MTTGLRAQPVSSPDHVLVLTADDSLVHAVRTALSEPRFELSHAVDSRAATTLLQRWQPALAIVDLDAASEALLDWAAHRLPSIGLTRSYAMAPRLHAFDRGADDVLVIPFAPHELLARATAVLRRSRGVGTSSGPRLRVGDLDIDLIRRRATLRGMRLDLTPVEQSLLYVLASNPGKVLARDQLLAAVWGGGVAATSNLVDRHISNLRIKLGDDPRAPRFITTVAGRGYRFDPSQQSGMRSLAPIHPDWSVRLKPGVDLAQPSAQH